MTIFIGENDCGKTSILKSLDYFLSNKLIPSEMFHKIEDIYERKCEIKLTFDVNSEKAKEIPKYFIINDKLGIKKIFILNNQNQVVTL